MIKLWVDDVRGMPCDYLYNVRSVYELMFMLTSWFGLAIEKKDEELEDTILIDLDHDAGEYVRDGGDYIKILEWLEWVKYNFPKHFETFNLKFRIHSGNPVGRENMKRIIEANGWELID